LPLAKTRFRVLSPDKALDLHGSKPTR
jgi:hypothetical protein